MAYYFTAEDFSFHKSWERPSAYLCLSVSQDLQYSFHVLNGRKAVLAKLLVKRKCYGILGIHRQSKRMVIARPQMTVTLAVPLRPRPIAKVTRGLAHEDTRKPLHLCGLVTLSLCVLWVALPV